MIILLLRHDAFFIRHAAAIDDCRHEARFHDA